MHVLFAFLAFLTCIFGSLEDSLAVRTHFHLVRSKRTARNSRETESGRSRLIIFDHLHLLGQSNPKKKRTWKLSAAKKKTQMLRRPQNTEPFFALAENFPARRAVPRILWAVRHVHFRQRARPKPFSGDVILARDVRITTTTASRRRRGAEDSHFLLVARSAGGGIRREQE